MFKYITSYGVSLDPEVKYFQSINQIMQCWYHVTLQIMNYIILLYIICCFKQSSLIDGHYNVNTFKV